MDKRVPIGTKRSRKHFKTKKKKHKLETKDIIAKYPSNDEDTTSSTKKTPKISPSFSSKNKRKNSLPLKVKMPFRISKKSNDSNTSPISKQSDDDDVDL